MDSQMQRDREAKADEAINAINRKAGRNMPQAVGTAIALIAIILLMMAHRGIKADDRLVKSMDRIR